MTNIKLDDFNYIILDFQKGGRTIQLVLSGVKIIEDKQKAEFLGSGNYLMLPWVNRLRKYQHDCPRKDGKGYPIHGYCTNLPRSYQIKKVQDLVIIQICLKQKHQLVPKFKEIFTLKKGTFSIQFIVEEQVKQNKFCFGYHPYFQINQEKLSEIQIQTDVNHQIELNEDLLPIYPFKIKEEKISSKNKYDSLFIGGSYFKLKGKNQISIQLQSSLKFWQVYTPDDTRIAIQPMSFCGNLYQICEIQDKMKQQNLNVETYTQNLPNKGFITIIVQNKLNF